MDFIQNFSKYFLEKHGKTTYDEICNKIKSKAQDDYNSEYLDIILKIALLSYWGMSDIQISEFLKDNANVNVAKIKEVHKETINEIQKYIEIISNENEK